MKKFNVVLADPAWTYRDKANAGKRGASHKYGVMTLEQICALPVQSIAAENCVLFLWAVPPMLPDAFRVIESWGFKYKTIGFWWAKRNKKANTPFFGMGHWTRANGEPCLLAIRGKPKRVNAGVSQFIWHRIARHSQKPDETRRRIVRLMGDVPRVELFARENPPGWDVWGNQCEATVKLT
jgi:N6-adenosine-specific RNA methylase IME4